MGADHDETMKRGIFVVSLTALLLVFFSATSSADGATAYRWGLYRGPAGTVTDRQSHPVAVGLTDVVALSAGNTASYALLSDGAVMAWGNGNAGQLGNGIDERFAATPVPVEFPADTTITAIAESNQRGFAIDSHGVGYSWGAQGADCGAGSNSVPRIVSGLPPVKSVAAAAGNTIWLSTTGDVYSCGKGSTGHGPTLVSLPQRVTAISAGRGVDTALLSDGSVWDWGNNQYGQLGDGTFSASRTPVQVQLPAGTYAVQVYAGGDDRSDGQQLALLNTGAVAAWGNDHYRQLGDGKTTNEPIPVYASVLDSYTIASVVAGGSTSYAITTSGQVLAWGNNVFGQAGVGNRTSVYPPAIVATGISLLSSTADNVLAY